jgi:hypothetical protein
MKKIFPVRRIGCAPAPRAQLVRSETILWQGGDGLSMNRGGGSMKCVAPRGAENNLSP